MSNEKDTSKLSAWLNEFITSHQGAAGSIHIERGGALYLAATKNIPPPVQRAVEVVPSGKGMAGIAFAEKRAVQTCNLKTDDSGAVKPGAKAVDAKAAVALPVFREDGEVRAVVGIAFMDERE